MPEVHSRPPPVVKVCHVIHSLARGGAERVLTDLAAVAPGAGLDMTVVSLMPVTGDGYAPLLAERGVRVRSLDLATRWDPRASTRLAHLLEGAPPHLLHAHLKHADLVCAGAARRLGVPWISTLHVIEDGVGPIRWMKRMLAARARSSAAVTIAVSAAQASWYRATFPGCIDCLEVLPNGVVSPPDFGEEDRRAIRDELGIPHDRVVAVMVAIMRPGKGHDDLLEAAGLLAPELPVTFVLAGSGPEETRLRGLANRARLGGDRVLFAGFREDIDRVVHAADFVVHPTHDDALPTAVLHAFAAGRPVVATATGGVPEVLGSGTGRLVPVGDPVALAEAIVELADDPDRRRWMGKRARERFDEEFDAVVWANRLRSLYHRVIAGGTATGGRC